MEPTACSGVPTFGSRAEVPNRQAARAAVAGSRGGVQDWEGRPELAPRDRGQHTAGPGLVEEGAGVDQGDSRRHRETCGVPASAEQPGPGPEGTDGGLPGVLALADPPAEATAAAGHLLVEQ